MITCEIKHGDALTVLRSMESESVQCVVTSPPYYGLRSYGTTPQIWDGDADCQHIWGEEMANPKTDTRPIELKISQGATVGSNVASQHWAQGTQGTFCQQCSAWRGELGLEPRFQLYISHLIQIFREVKRVLKSDGCCFVNLGDSYSGDSPVRNVTAEAFSKTWDTSQTRTNGGNRRSQVCSVPRKSLMNIPHRFFIAMTDDLQMIQRNNINWWKRACMPSSATDRWTVDFESIGFFTKNAKYKFNQDLEPQKNWGLRDRTNGKYHTADLHSIKGVTGVINPEGRNARTTWDIAYEPSGEDHYASYPTKLVEKMILAGSDAGDTVLDIFNGTASTGVAALRHRRNYIGIELQDKYITISEMRLSKVQVKLF